MSLTYTPLGLDLGLPFALLLSAMSLLPIRWLALKRNGPILGWPDILVSMSWILVGLTGLPTTLALGPLIILPTLWTFWRKPKTGDHKPQVLLSLAVSAIMIAAGAGIMWLGAQASDTLTLKAYQVTFTDFKGQHAVPKAGLRVHAVRGPKSWWSTNSWSWTSYSGDDLGPHLMGNMIYWCPEGLVRGDDLGVKLASWANTKPIYREFSGSSPAAPDEGSPQ